MKNIPSVTVSRNEWHLNMLQENGAPIDPSWELKDPSIVRLQDGRYRLYASVGSSVTQTWMIGMFESKTLDSDWKFVGRTQINLDGDRVCAPALVYDQTLDSRFVLDVQSECFLLPGRECEIFRAYSTDGYHFVKDEQPLVTKEQLYKVGYDVIGVYDAGTSIVQEYNQTQEVVLFSAYRRDRINDIPRLFGDIYMISRSLGESPSAWSEPKLVISQDHVPFHNQPFGHDAEWGVEGAKVIQLGEECYLWVFVSFLEGHQLRQRVTWATSRSLHAQPTLIGVTYPAEEGQENGHSDIFIDGDKVIEVRQQREGKDGKWYLVGSQYDRSALFDYCNAINTKTMPTIEIPTVGAEVVEALEHNFL